jgi:hypothetical protein
MPLLNDSHDVELFLLGLSADIYQLSRLQSFIPAARNCNISPFPPHRRLGASLPHQRIPEH